MEDYKNLLTAPSGVFTIEDEKEVMEIVQRFADECGWSSELLLMDDVPERPLLRMDMGALGKVQVGTTVELEMIHPDDKNLFVMAQLAVGVFDNVPKEHAAEVMRACNRLNAQVMAGTFGIKEELLFFRHPVILRPDFPLEASVQMLVDGIINLHQAIDMTIDGLAVITQGMMTLEETIEAGYLE